MDFLSEPWDISEETDRLNQKLFGSSLSPLSKINVKRQKVKTKGRMERRADNHGECESSDMSKRKSERKGKKRTLESVSSYEKSKRKKIIGQTLESESNTEEHSNNFDSNTVRKKKKKNKKNKFKLDNTDNVTRQPGGKHFQRRETKKDSIRSAAEEALTKDRRPEENVAQVTVEEGTSRHEKTNNKTVVRGKDNQVSESVKRDKSGKQNENFRKSLKKVKGEKKKKSKAKSDTNSANKSDGSVHSANNSLSEISNDVKKKTFNPAILASMLASVSKSETTGKKEDVQNKRTEVDTEPRKNKSKKQKKTEMEDEATSKLEKTPSQPLSLKEKLMEQLNSARFRYINEQLYTQTGEEAQEMFAEDEEAFKVYHQGFQTQVNKWPINPVDILIKDIRQLPRNKVIADFGCGDAKIARNVSQKVHSFDLVSLNDHVTACDMAHVPLGDASVDVAVFCLSLMGTNLSDYLIEAYRVLKTGGQLKIAEVASRFQSLPQFLLKIEQFGFHQESKDTSNKMFYLFNLKKKGKPKGKAPQLNLEPCVYKKR